MRVIEIEMRFFFCKIEGSLDLEIVRLINYKLAVK